MEKPELSKADLTRERILIAATEEFSSFGIAGGRVDRIAKAAKANKSLIYEYFGSKDLLFKAVFERSLSNVFSSVGFTAGDLPGYAGRLFDFAMDHPYMMRLVMWNSLEVSPDWPLNEQISLEAQARAIAQEQQRGTVGDDYPPDFLLTVIVTLAAAWTTSNPFGISNVRATAEGRAVLRDAIIRAVSQLSKKGRP